MRTKYLCLLSASSLIFGGCSSNTPSSEHQDEPGSSEEIIPSDEPSGGKFIDATVSYGEDNSIRFGDPIDKRDFKFILKYEDRTIKVDQNEFDLELDGSVFTFEDIDATLTYKVDPTIKKELKITVNPRKTLKLLFIGNSFSDDTIQWMYEIGEDLGIKVTVESMFIGGCTLDTHFNNLVNNYSAYEWIHRVNGSWVRTPNSSLSGVLQNKVWDFISLQQASGYSGIYESYNVLPSLIENIKPYLVDEYHTQFIWNMTWAYQSDSTHPDFAKYSNDQLTMYNAIINVNKNYVSTINDIVTIIPNGTAIQNARTSYIGDKLTRDGFHLSYDLGRYIAGLTTIKTLTGVDIDKCNFTTVGKQATVVAKESANNAINNKFEITNSKETENDINLDSLKNTHHKMGFNWSNGYYNATTDFPGEINYSGSNFDRGFYCCDIKETSAFVDGTVIYIKDGYKYRPEGWINKDEKYTGTRPGNVSVEFSEVTNFWKDKFNYRAFNVSRIDGAPLSEEEKQGIDSGDIFAVYIPND